MLSYILSVPGVVDAIKEILARGYARDRRTIPKWDRQESPEARLAALDLGVHVSRAGYSVLLVGVGSHNLRRVLADAGVGGWNYSEEMLKVQGAIYNPIPVHFSKSCNGKHEIPLASVNLDTCEYLQGPATAIMGPYSDGLYRDPDGRPRLTPPTEDAAG